ncbi:MAG: Fis family transcriptional regulator [Spirochaetes bacterium GWC1_27_15]|nr:MAG: Fis family transcriptional regulator [Spirochaetes bacterium GWB1_27_13]OHD20998.1 MAG: Fis family transcriptional regulator [Spirochaetes bacterium GWC1_27_15]
MNILIVDDEENIREILKDILIDENHTVFTAEDGTDGLEYFNKEKIDVCFLDVWMPKIGGIDVLKKVKEEYPNVEIVMISGHAKIDQAVRATRLGAYDFLEKPLTMEKIIGIVKTIENSKKNKNYEKPKNFIMDTMVGSSFQMQAIKELIENSSKTDARILILGENGTGKELVAREIHNKSLRSNKPFISVNCAAIPETLIESELFGHSKGSFTGATSDRIGKFELANTGTLFLDEVADMSLATQAKVLRVLQEMKLTKIGSSEVISVDVRIIAATNKDIREEIKKGTFREDLFYRLNVIPFFIPPLRERKDDIPLLIEYFFNKICSENKIPKKELSKDALEYLKDYSWPGNIRQLRNIVERLLIMVAQNIIEVADLEKHLDDESDIYKDSDILTKYDDFKLNTAMDEFERDFIEKKLKENNYNISKTAKTLGVYPSNLYSKINKLGIDIEEAKKNS